MVRRKEKLLLLMEMPGSRSVHVELLPMVWVIVVSVVLHVLSGESGCWRVTREKSEGGGKVCLVLLL